LLLQQPLRNNNNNVRMIQKGVALTTLQVVSLGAGVRETNVLRVIMLFGSAKNKRTAYLNGMNVQIIKTDAVTD